MPPGPAQRDFDLPPPLPGPWVTLDDPGRRLLLQRLDEAAFPDIPANRVAAVRILPLAFYPGWMLCDLLLPPREGEEEEGADAADRLHSLLYGPDGFTLLDGTAAPLHVHNLRHDVTLETEEEQIAYLCFFCRYVFGSEGPFEVIFDTQGLTLGDPAPAIVPVTRQEPPERRYICSYRATILYGQGLFVADMGIENDGTVIMLDDTPLQGEVTRNPPLGFSGTARYVRRDGPDA